MDVAIVGAGFAGIGMAIALKKAGSASFVVLERARDVGGTWRDNDYPGCACDIPSMLYSFSFEQRQRWSRIYPLQSEIWDYLRRCTDKYGIRPHIRFESELREARYDEGSATWTVRTQRETLRTRVLITGLGPLNKPAIPALPGIERFGGVLFHSSQWNHAFDCAGKDVAVVGTGASAIQFVPELAPRVRRLSVFQRTAPWIIPKLDGPVGPLQQALRRFVPFYAWTVRKLIYWLLELRAYGFTIDPRQLAVAEKIAQRHLERQVPDPALRRALTPDYRLGCKRVLLSNDYYPALQRDNVELVTAPIAEVRERSIVTADGVERPIDALILGTGFQATSGVAPVAIYGRGGLELNEAWRNGIEAYVGITVAGFPNFFMLVGPNTGLGHNSVVFMIEAQVRYVMSALAYMRSKKVDALDVRSDVQLTFNRALQRRMSRTVWASGCKSWYLDERGKNVTLWPGFTFVYRLLTRRLNPEHYSKTRLPAASHAPAR